MKTFEEILVEENALYEPSAEKADNLVFTRDYNRGLVKRIIRAGERYANQRTEDLQAKILIYREEFCPSHEVGWYDELFGITSQRNLGSGT